MRALIDGTFLTWLPRDDWRESHPRFKALCHASLLRLLGGTTAASKASAAGARGDCISKLARLL